MSHFERMDRDEKRLIAAVMQADLPSVMITLPDTALNTINAGPKPERSQ